MLQLKKKQEILSSDDLYRSTKYYLYPSLVSGLANTMQNEMIDSTIEGYARWGLFNYTAVFFCMVEM